MTEDMLTNMLLEYKEKQDILKKVTLSIDLEIARLQSYRNKLTEPIYGVLQDIETKIRIVVLDTKQSYVCEYGKITYRKGGIKRSWDLDALDHVCEFDEHIKEVIWTHRKETSFVPSILIKLSE